jgi:hypothetical protein
LRLDQVPPFDVEPSTRFTALVTFGIEPSTTLAVKGAR